jgi:outer membrane lipoprotein-sorting protein
MKILLVALFVTFEAAMASEFLPKTFSAKFEQEYESTLKGKVKKGNGNIDYKFPGHIRFESSTPSTVIFTSNDEKSWYYRAPFIEGEQGEVTETSAKNGNMSYIKFFDSLKNGLVSNKYYSVESGELVKLKFNEATAKILGLKESKLSFKLKGSQKFSDLDYIELIFPDGKKSKLKFIELKTNVVFPNDKFNFIYPPNTKKTN